MLVKGWFMIGSGFCLQKVKRDVEIPFTDWIPLALAFGNEAEAEAPV